MELDDLKQAWNQSNSKQTKNKDIMEMIQQPDYGPVAALKKAFRKQIALVITLMAFVIITTVKDTVGLSVNVMFWAYIAFCFGLIIFYYFNYRIVKQMEVMDTDIRSNLEKQITILETRLRWKRIGLRVTLLFFIALAEILPYYQHYRMLDKWHALATGLRIGAYVLFLILQYFANKRVMQLKFGNHLAHLKKLVKDME
jgi:hypothetical protein